MGCTFNVRDKCSVLFQFLSTRTKPVVSVCEKVVLDKLIHDVSWKGIIELSTVFLFGITGEHSIDNLFEMLVPFETKGGPGWKCPIRLFVLHSKVLQPSLLQITVFTSCLHLVSKSRSTHSLTLNVCVSAT